MPVEGLLEVGEKLANLGTRLTLYVTLPIVGVGVFVFVMLHIRKGR